MDPTNISKIRNEYRLGELDASHVHPDPVIQFGEWMKQALDSGIEEPSAMTLATATRDGIPSARMVLLKGFDERGFTFFTNHMSRKGRELEANPVAALVFFWKELERQVRVEGRVEKIPSGGSDDYFASRPAESQVSAIISPQSDFVPGRDHLEKLREEYLSAHAGPHKRPKYWGGYCLLPVAIEFWQGRPGRLHDRILYRKTADGWAIRRLAP